MFGEKYLGPGVIHLLLFFLFISFEVRALDDKNLKWTDLNIGSIAEIREYMPFYPHRANTHNSNILSKDNFQSSEVCGSCHVEIYQQWSNSMMGYSWDDPIYRALLKRASEATNGDVDNFCTGCHTPIGLTTRQITSEVNRAPLESEGENPLPGVDCESCHNITGRTGIDNGAYDLNFHVQAKPVKYGPRSDAVSPFHDTAYSELHTRSDFCGTCHNVTHPFNNVPIERTYDEWVESPYAKEGVACQDCHMKPFAGKAAIMGPDRPDVASHDFPGGNSTVLNHMGSFEAAEQAREMLRDAAKIKLKELPAEIQAGTRNRVVVKVENTGAGHKLPTGFPEGREIWIDFSVVDGNGREVYRLGQVKDGKTEPNTRNFKVHLGDKDGNEVDIEVWNVTHIISDNRILPRGYGLAEYEFFVPGDAVGPFEITATLNYWAFPQALVDYLLGEGVMEVDIVKMAEISELVH